MRHTSHSPSLIFRLIALFRYSPVVSLMVFLSAITLVLAGILTGVLSDVSAATPLKTPQLEALPPVKTPIKATAKAPFVKAPAKPAVVAPDNPALPPPPEMQGLSSLASVPAAQNVLLVLDASYSMSETLASGETKMTAAKRTLLELLKKIPADTNLGLRVYGHVDSMFPCAVTDLLVPLGKNNRRQIAEDITRLKPTGATPISRTLRKAINEDFTGITGEKTVVLVSDGMETCGVDPCGAVVNLMRAPNDIKINVIGFGLNELDAVKQLRCIALASYGKFYNARTAADLADSLGKSVAARATVQGQIIRH